MTANQPKKEPRNKAAHLGPYQFKPGQSGNPLGRGPGKSMKEFTRDLLSRLSDEERINFLKGMKKLDVWEMGEGKADTKGVVDIKVPDSLASLFKNAVTKPTTDNGVEGENTE